MGISSVLCKLTIKGAMASEAVIGSWVMDTLGDVTSKVQGKKKLDEKISTATGTIALAGLKAVSDKIGTFGKSKPESTEPIKQEELKIEGLGAVFSKEAERLEKMFQKNTNLFLGTFALAMYIGRLNGDAEAELEKIRLCLEHDTMLREDLKSKMQEIYQAELDFSIIKENYLDAVSFRELHCMDSIIREIAIKDGNIFRREKDFLKESWIPYFIDRIGEE